MKKIKASNNGMEILVDDEDFPLLSRHNILAHRSVNVWYAHITIGTAYASLHMIVMGPHPKSNGRVKRFIDHINGNGLDNRRRNLRFVTQGTNMQNARNRNKMSNKTGYVGVTRCSKNSWSSTINCNKKVYRHRHDTKLEAAKAYDAKALKLFGEGCYLNFPE